MLANYAWIKESKTFPFDTIKTCLDWKHDKFLITPKILKEETEKGTQIIPLFSIDNQEYVPKIFTNNVNKNRYLGRKTFDELFTQAQGIKRTTVPRMWETIDYSVYGLIPWLNGKTLYEFYNKRKKTNPLTEITEVVECALELKEQKLFHIDIHSRNIIKLDKIHLIDPTLSSTYITPPGKYYDIRHNHFHWAPEMKTGGIISEKSSVYEVGYLMQEILEYKTTETLSKKQLKKLQRVKNHCLALQPRNRPYFTDVYTDLLNITSS